MLVYSLFAYIADGRFGTQWATECFGFIYGMLFFYIKKRFEENLSAAWFLKTLCMLIISGVFGVAYLKFKPVPFAGSYLLKIVLGIAITLLVLFIVYRFKLGNKVSRFLGKISYEVYLIHGVMFAVIRNIAPQLDSGVFILVSIIGTILLAWVIELVANKIISSKR